MDAIQPPVERRDSHFLGQVADVALWPAPRGEEVRLRIIWDTRDKIADAVAQRQTGVTERIFVVRGLTGTGVRGERRWKRATLVRFLALRAAARALALAWRRWGTAHGR